MTTQQLLKITNTLHKTTPNETTAWLTLPFMTSGHEINPAYSTVPGPAPGYNQWNDRQMLCAFKNVRNIWPWHHQTCHILSFDNALFVYNHPCFCISPTTTTCQQEQFVFILVICLNTCTMHIQHQSKMFIPRFWIFFWQWLRIFKQNFTHLLYVHIYGKLSMAKLNCSILHILNVNSLPSVRQYAPLIRLQRMVLYKFTLID